MLDIKFIRENLDAVKKNCSDRGVSVDVDRLVALDENFRDKQSALEDIRRQQNDTAKAMKQKLSDDERSKLIDQGKRLKAEAEAAEAAAGAAASERDELLRQVPNMTHPDAPVGPGETANRELRVHGIPVKFGFKARDHVELGAMNDLIDFESGAKVAGQKFFYLKNEAALMELALAQYAMSVLVQNGFTPIVTPDLARASILDGIGFNPRGNETQIYSIENSDLCLIATAEITLGGMLQGDIIDGSKLPMKFAGFSHCFRTEAGAAGKESKGLYRVHQFTKVEMFAFCAPEDSEKLHDEFVELEEKIFQGLEIPYRVVDIGTGDLGGPAYRKFDLEAWMPGRGEGGEWGEVTSTSNCTDYQARRLKIRYRREGEKKPRFVHMLNGTAIANSRALIAVMENGQKEDGSISIPKALRPYMNDLKEIKRS
jgi:seryl-tRNA synthetase